MATAPLTMPKLGLTMTEGLVAAWVAQPGQRVAAGDVLLVVETEKTTTDVEATADGVLTEILVPAGEKVPVGTVLARWREDAEAAPARPPDATPTQGAMQARIEDVPGARGAAAPRAGGAPAPRVVATPFARRLARERSIDLRSVRGTGPGGRVKACDVPQARPAPTPAGTPARGPRAAGELVDPTPFHLAMARSVTEAKRDIPHFYVSADAEIGFLTEYRRKRAELGDVPRVTLTHLLLKAVGQALVELPAANVVWHEGRLLRLSMSDVGLAVATDRGVVMPMLRDAGRLALPEVASRADALAERARRGRLREDDLGGGAVGVSNLGMHGVASVTPIIQPPHSAILGVGAVRELFRPGRDGRPELRRELGLVLACDHRVFDGVAAATFLNAVIALLQNPLRLAAR
jgi:pyruvate dehydrogenase E2 component (dihydrolipoamide acetyltransferase)